MKDEYETLGPKCVWRMMQFLRSRTKISEIGFVVLQIGGSIWNLQRENDINREKNGDHYHFPTGRHITKCPTFAWRRSETYHEMSHLCVTSEGDISRNVPPLRDVRGRHITKCRGRHITKCPTFAWRQRETYRNSSWTRDVTQKKPCMHLGQTWGHNYYHNLFSIMQWKINDTRISSMSSVSLLETRVMTMAGTMQTSTLLMRCNTWRLKTSCCINPWK
jgi:hypothetical protein